MSNPLDHALASLAQSRLVYHSGLVQQQKQPPVYTYLGENQGRSVLQTAGGVVEVGQPITNGSISSGAIVPVHVAGDVVRVNGMPRIHPSPTQSITPSQRNGILMWLDSNWLNSSFTQFVPGGQVADNIFFFKELLLHFLRGRAKKLYTLALDDTRLYRREQADITGDIAISALAAANVELVYVKNIKDAKGLFFLPLLKPTERFTSAEITAARQMARKYGLLVAGEWRSWLDYDRYLIEKLGLRRGIRVENGEGFDYAYLVKGRKISSLEGKILNGAAYGRFVDLKREEAFVIAKDEESNDNAVFAWFAAP
jgi:hypothetical protein